MSEPMSFVVPDTAAGLRADRFVADHGDVTNPAVANTLLGAIGWPA